MARCPDVPCRSRTGGHEADPERGDALVPCAGRVDAPPGDAEGGRLRAAAGTEELVNGLAALGGDDLVRGQPDPETVALLVRGDALPRRELQQRRGHGGLPGDRAVDGAEQERPLALVSPIGHGDDEPGRLRRGSGGGRRRGAGGGSPGGGCGLRAGRRADRRSGRGARVGNAALRRGGGGRAAGPGGGPGFLGGQATTIVLLLLLSSFQLFFLFILGQYVARIYDEARNRPLYVIASTRNLDVESVPAQLSAPPARISVPHSAPSARIEKAEVDVQGE